MGWRIEAGGYTAELTDDLEIVYRNPRGRKLKQLPEQMQGAPGLAAMFLVRRYLKRHEEQCDEAARSWAAQGVGVPRVLADADPFWAEALDAAGVTLTTEPVEGGLCARTYVGPDDRRLTQVLREPAVRYRDLLMAVDGWEPEGLFETGLHDPYGDVVPFPESIIAAHPDAERLAVEKVHTLEVRTGRWRYFYKPSVEEILAGLEESAPALLISLLDAVADAALDHDEPDLASAWFGRARKLERALAHRPDPEWLAGRYEEHAHVLSATVLRAWARDLGARGAATPEGLARFREVAVWRVEAGGDVYPQLAADLRKIAKAAGLDPEEELAAFLRPVFAAGEVSLGDEAFWTDALKGRAMDLVSGPEAARRALDLRPKWPTHGPLWLKLLDRSGALAMLTGDVPGLQRGEAAAWLVDCVQGHDHWKDPVGELYEVAERIGPRLAADGVPVAFRFWRLDETGRRRTPLDMIDMLLEHGVPVADPPERLGPAFLPDLVVARRPGLRHVLADERFARELRARARGDLDMTVGDSASNTWYEPHETKGWGRLPGPFDNPIGHEEVRAWCARERARLREGVDLYGLRMLLARFVHVGAAVDLLLKDAETAREFAAVDVMALLMADLPDEFTRERVDGLVKLLVPDYINRSVSGPNFVALSQALPELKEQDRATFDRVAFSLVTAVNCRVGLERLVRRLTPGDEPEAEPRAQSADPVVRQCGRLMDLAGSGTPVWDGDLSTPSARLDGNVVGLEFRPNHANTAAYTGALSRSRPSPHQMPAAYATYPFVSGEPGRWRVVRCELPEATERGTVSPGTAFRTATSVALVVGVDYQAPLERVLLEYAPEGEFAEEGPLATAGAGLLDACVLEPVRSADWFARFSELWRERDRPPVSPELAAVFAEKTGLSEAEAAVVLQGALLSAPYQLAPDDPVRLVHPGSRPSRWTRWSPEMDRARESLRALRPPEFYTRLYERLLPDDPEELWSSGPAVDRAAAWCSQESGAPFPLPSGLLPRALKEITQPRGEAPLPRAPRASPWVWRSGRPSLRPWVLIGRVAAGGDCLADASAFSGEPDPLALPRVAAWLAYRTPAGDPLRPAIGAAISRLREAAGPRTLFSLQSNHLMGAPPPTGVLTGHPAVTLVEDDVFSLSHLRVDPAAVKGPDDPLLDTLDDYYDATLPSQVVPSGSGLPALADLRLLLSDDFAALGAHLAADADLAPGWEQHPARSVPHLVEECAETHRLGEDAAALYLMLLALPDPSDRNVKEWTGWKPARFKAAVAELGGSGLVLNATRARAGRSLFVHGAWREYKAPRLPIEVPKIRLLPLAEERRSTANMAVVPSGPVPVLFDRAWRNARPHGLR